MLAGLISHSNVSQVKETDEEVDDVDKADEPPLELKSTAAYLHHHFGKWAKLRVSGNLPQPPHPPWGLMYKSLLWG
jgi:hypothetical protein